MHFKSAERNASIRALSASYNKKPSVSMTWIAEVYVLPMSQSHMGWAAPAVRHAVTQGPRLSILWPC